jgi:hypothetical protein
MTETGVTEITSAEDLRQAHYAPERYSGLLS